MWASTYGKGPYRPAIKFDDGLYVFDLEFEEENEAYLEANRMYKEAASLVKDCLRSHMYYIKTFRGEEL